MCTEIGKENEEEYCLTHNIGFFSSNKPQVHIKNELEWLIHFEELL